MKTAEKSVDEIKEEIQYTATARDFFKTVSTSRRAEAHIRNIALADEQAFENRLQELEADLAKLQKR